MKKKKVHHYGPSHVETTISQFADEPQVVTITGRFGNTRSITRHRYTSRSGFYYRGWYRGDKACSIVSIKTGDGIFAKSDPGAYWFPYDEDIYSQAHKYDSNIIYETQQIAKEKCGNRLLGDLNEAKFSAAVFYAEARKTLKMLHETAQKLNALFRWFKGGGYKTLKLYNQHVGTVNDVSNLWLQYKYGWMPLYSEIYQAMINISRPELNHFIVRAHSSHNSEHSVEDEDNSDFPLILTFLEQWTTESGCTMKADLSITNTALFNVQQLGLQNPLEVAWEVIPFSFVADWFLPVSNYLSMLTAMQGLTINSASTTEGMYSHGVRTLQSKTYGGTFYYNKVDGFYHWKTVKRVLEVPQYPTLSFNNPFKQLKGTAEKTATSFALLRQVLSGKKGAGNY